VRDVQRLKLSPDAGIANAGLFDVLLVPGGHGQQALIHDMEVLGLICRRFAAEKLLFSVCTGALLCGAAGIPAGRQVTTHWSTRHLRNSGRKTISSTVRTSCSLLELYASCRILSL
jgi:cyclohexyl-isocyanide hydratase